MSKQTKKKTNIKLHCIFDKTERENVELNFFLK